MFILHTPLCSLLIIFSGGALENASEDLFMSDDELSEPQLWAMLDTVECKFISHFHQTCVVLKVNVKSYALYHIQ